jgi:hypothetical protein
MTSHRFGRCALVLAVLGVGVSVSAEAALFVNQYGIGTSFSSATTIRTATLPANGAVNTSAFVNEFNWGSANIIGQSFTATQTGNLAYFEIPHSSAGETVLTFGLYDMGTGPFDEPWNIADAVGTDLLANRANTVTVGGAAQQVVQFYFTGPDEIPVVAGRRYMFRVIKTGAFAGDFGWYRNANGAFYPDGDGYRFNEGANPSDPDGVIIRGGTAVRDMGLGVGYALPPGWQLNTGGNWDDGASWRGGLPDSVGSAANFATTLNAAGTVNLGSNRTVGSLSFNSAPNGYTLSGSTIVLDNGGNAASITVVAGSHTISSTLQPVGGLNVTVESAESVLDVTSVLNMTGNLVKSGPGELAVAGLSAGGVTVSAGGLVISGEGGVVSVTSLSLTEGNMDLGTNDLVVNYSGASPLADLQSLIESGQLASDADFGGVSTLLVLFEAADFGLTEYEGVGVDGESVIGKYTYVGDANLDGQVDAFDYSVVDDNFGSSASFVGGDLNGDGFVDAFDYSSIDDTFGAGVNSPLRPAGTTEVFIPEPSSVGLMMLCGGVMGRRNRN